MPGARRIARDLDRSTTLLIAALCSLAAALWCAPPAAGAAPVEAIEAWAYPEQAAPVRQGASEAAAVVSRLHFTTELGHPEVYRVTGRVDPDQGATWLRIDVLGRPNGRVGWVPEEALGSLRRAAGRLVIRRARLRATFIRGGKRVWSAPIGIGEGRWPTPAGSYYVREAARIPRGGGVYGSFAFGLSAYAPRLSDWPGGGVIGIHGTNEPALIPGRISHGCIRVRNPQINRLKRLMRVGTPVLIR